jgi:ferrochelatase
MSLTSGRTSAIDAVLLIAFGGPTAPSEIRPFLDNVARGRAIPRERLEEVARHYEAMPGGRSPLDALTQAQAAGLRARLGGEVAVYVGMRNWHPFLHETLATMARDGRRRALGVILSAFRCEASWERYMADVAAARARAAGAPEVVYAPPWFEHPRFVAAVADRVRAAFETVPEPERAGTPLVFTAHAIPRAMAETSPYVADFCAAAAAVARRLGHARWLLAYQSRSGGPRDPWLEPDVGETIRDLVKAGEGRVVLAPIGFVVDHVEVLYDLDTEARAIAAQHGVSYHRAAAVNDHPEFVEMLAEMVYEAQGRTEPGRA